MVGFHGIRRDFAGSGGIWWSLWDIDANDRTRVRMDMLAVNLKLKVHIFYLYPSFRCWSQRGDIENPSAFRAIPHIRGNGMDSCPGGRYQGWHSEAILRLKAPQRTKAPRRLRGFAPDQRKGVTCCSDVNCSRQFGHSRRRSLTAAKIKPKVLISSAWAWPARSFVPVGLLV